MTCLTSSRCPTIYNRLYICMHLVSFFEHVRPGIGKLFYFTPQCRVSHSQINVASASWKTDPVLKSAAPQPDAQSGVEATRCQLVTLPMMSYMVDAANTRNSEPPTYATTFSDKKRLR